MRRTGGVDAVILTWSLDCARRLFDCLEGAGHRVGTLVTIQSQRGRAEGLSARDLARHRQLLEQAPPALDIVVAAAVEHLPGIVGLLSPELLVCYGFPCRLPDAVLRVPPLGALNVHPSLLPMYRGPNPLGRSVHNGDDVGLSVHRMVTAFDAGQVLAQRAVRLRDDDDAYRIQAKVGELVTSVLPLAVELARDGEPGTPQDEARATRAPLFEDHELVVAWDRPARDVHNQVRACALASSRTGRRGARAVVDGRPVRVLKTSLDASSGGLRVACCDGPVWVVETDALPESELADVQRA